MKLLAENGILTITDGSDNVLVALSTGSYAIRLIATLGKVQVETFSEKFQFSATQFTHVNGAAFSGTLQELMDALSAGLSDQPIPVAITSDGAGDEADLEVDEEQTEVTTVTAKGGTEPYVFSIDGGVDAALFEIDAGTGVLAFVDAPDFETPGDDDEDNVHEVIVKVTDDDGRIDTQALHVTVEDVEE